MLNRLVSGAPATAAAKRSDCVTVNAVCPGYTNTEIIGHSIDKIVAATGRSRDEALAEMVKVNPQQRLIEPEEVAATVMWICQQESITGQSIAVAGGEVM